MVPVGSATRRGEGVGCAGAARSSDRGAGGEPRALRARRYGRLPSERQLGRSEHGQRIGVLRIRHDRASGRRRAGWAAERYVTRRLLP